MEGVQQILDSQIAPIVPEYSQVSFFESTGKIVRSFLTVHSLDLGVVGFDEYRFVARRTRLGHQLVKRHLAKLFRRIPSLLSEDPAIECFTVPVYARVLFDGALLSMMVDMLTLHTEIPASKICVEFSADLLYEDLTAAKKRMDELRALGVKIALFEVGDPFCPVLRLSELGFDLAFLDASVTDTLGTDGAESNAESLIRHLHGMNVRVIAPNLDSEERIEAAQRVGADGYTADAAVSDNAVIGGADDGE